MLISEGKIMKFKPFEKSVYLSSPTMHGEELEYIAEAYNTNWMSTVGENINKVEESMADFLGCRHSVGLSSGTSALHLAFKAAGVKRGDRVFASDMTFAATVNPITYEGGIPIFIDCERDTWNMDPDALRKAFKLYPDVKVVVVANLYGTPAKLSEIVEICRENGAVLVEDAAESLGATYKGRQTGSFGKYNVISFNGNKIITGSTGGMLLTDDADAAARVRFWSTQSRENAPWYQHNDVGYNYRMSNVVAGVVRGQFKYLNEHIQQKKAIFERYKEGFKELPVSMNPYIEGDMSPNFWLSCMTIDEDYMCPQTRTALTAEYTKIKGRSCPTEILQLLKANNAEGRPIWKPMHMQPFFADNPFVTAGEECIDEDIFNRGLCLPSDNKMTAEQQDIIIEMVKSCFQ